MAVFNKNSGVQDNNLGASVHLSWCYWLNILYKYGYLGPVYTIPDSLVTTSSFAVMEQWLVANAY